MKKLLKQFLVCAGVSLALITFTAGAQAVPPVRVSKAAQVKVTLDRTGDTLGRVMSEIQNQTGLQFFYNDVVIDRSAVVDINVSDVPLDQVMEELFGTKVKYSVVNGLIVLTRNDAQQEDKITVTGTVLDTDGLPVVGAIVVLKEDPTKGGATDIDGHFRIANIPANGTLKVSYVGMITIEQPINGKSEQHIVLHPDTELLDEVVVVGYGTMRKSDVTGAIASVSGEDLTKRSTTNPAEALQGQLAGVNVQKSGGNAGAGVSVKIRGVNTFGSNEPLYIIDGFQGDINSINPQDIVSLEVLKDGAAAAIYGSVAANGVVLVTTKSGEAGDLKVDLSTYLSSVHVAKQLELLNAAEYKHVHKQMYDNYNAYASEKVALPAYITSNNPTDTDWQAEMLRPGLNQNYMISLRGGSKLGTYALSYNRSDEKGIFKGNNYRHDNVRAKLNMKKGIVSVDATLGFKYTQSRQPEYQIKEMYMIAPLVPVYDETKPSGYGLTDFDGLPNNRNVAADEHFKDNLSRKYHNTANLSATVDIIDGLTFRTSYGYRGEHQRNKYHVPPYIADNKSKQEYTEHSELSAYWEEQIWDNVLNYTQLFGKHSVGAMVGSSLTDERYEYHETAVEGKTTIYGVDENGKLITREEAAGFLDPSFDTINGGKGGTYSGQGTRYDYRRLSFFGRVNYSYADRYLIQATLRQDGSSKFGADSRWGLFPSVALGWRITEEDFFPDNSVVSNLKLRASWGRLGNEVALGKYDFLARVSTYNNKRQGYVKGSGENPWPGTIATGLENRGLKWETSDNKNIGLDFGFVNNKLTGSLNLFDNRTNDLLITKVLAPSVGLDDPTMNVGVIQNRGVELELAWNDRVGDFNYNVGLNVSTLQNKVLELSDKNQVITGEGLKYGTEHFPTQTRVGLPIGAFYLYKTDGLFQSQEEVNRHADKSGNLLQPNAKPGDVRFVDVNGDGVLNDEDKVYLGSGHPKVEANLSFGCTYQGIDLSILLSGAFGHKLYNGNRYFYEGMNSGSNFLKSTLNAWTPDNRNTNVPRAVYSDPNGNMLESDRFLESGDFIRLRQVQIGYSLPAEWLEQVSIDSTRFYISGENLLTFTKYTGIDPEFSRANVLNTGIDKLIYPFTRSVTVGLQMTF